MALPLVVNGNTYLYPEPGDSNWGNEATDWASAVTAGMLQKAGGTFQLLAEVDFGSGFGIKSLYLKSRAANPASSGQVRLGSADSVAWRNTANSADLALAIDGSDRLTFNGTAIQNLLAVSDTSTIDLSLTADVLAADIKSDSITNSLINASAAIAYSKLDLAGSVVNADISNSAAIDFSKLASLSSGNILVGSSGNVATSVAMTGDIGISDLGVTAIQAGVIVNADISASAAIAYSKLNLSGSIVNADIGASAAIARSKIASGSANHVIINDVSGNLSSEATLAKSRGGSGQDNSSLTFPSSGTLATLAGVESFSNKTFSDAITQAQIATPGSPSAGQNKLYFKSNGQLYSLNSSGLETPVGVSGGAKNYLGVVNGINGNGNFELGSTTGWSLGNVTLTSAFPSGVPTFGSGASGNLSISTVSSGQLAGTYSLSYASSAATTAGNLLASNAFTIDIEDQAKPLTFSFYYKAQTNPTNGNYSGTSSNSFGVAIYDVTNSVWIMPAGVWGMTQNSGVGFCTGTFQTTSNSTQYRIVVFNANATSGATTLYFDDFFLGPQTAPLGAAITDWQAYTPTFTGLGTPSSVNFWWRRVGDSVEISGTLVCGSTTGVTAGVSLPSGMSVDTSKLPSSLISVGEYFRNAAGAATVNHGGAVLASSSSGSTLNVSETGVFGNGSTNPFTAQTGSGTFGSSDKLSFLCRVPVAGWSSNVQLSSDTDTRVIAFSGSKTTNQSVTGDVTDITFTAVSDTSGSWNGSQFVVPVAGNYNIEAQLGVTSGSAVNFRVYVNGSLYKKIIKAIGSANAVSGGSILAYNLKAGDTISVRCDTSDTVNGAASGSNAEGQLYIFRLSGPAVVAATESVNCRYKVSGSQSPSTTTPVNYDVKDFDSHNAVTTGASWRFTSPVSGVYSVSAADEDTAGARRFDLYKNGTIYCGLGSSGAANFTISGTTLIRLNAGDYVDVRPNAAASTSASGNNNWIAIARVGN